MDHELKQRLIGAVVVTALAAIFIPMLFDDPVDTSGKTVTELAIPQAPSDTAAQTAQNLPENKAQVLSQGDSELAVSEDEEAEQGSSKIEGKSTPDVAQSLSATENPSENEKASEKISGADGNQTAEPQLDTGIVEESGQAEDQIQPVAKPLEPAKKIKPDIAEPVAKPVEPEKTKVKTATVAEKEKTVTKTPKNAAEKSGSKLVRYSIQAGSFNKKENAQALVDKLRKQGLPASLVSKGNLYRVKVGPELDKKKASDIKAKLDKQNIGSLLISE